MSAIDDDARRLVEIRAYRLKPGTRDDFHAAVTHDALPMVRAYGMDVVTHGPVPNDDNGYFLVRSFASLAELTAQEDEFYGSAPWREGPRESLVSRIETYVDTLLWLGPAAIADLRAGNPPPSVVA
ncbi:NIPSNAP family protein [Scleromatobacter humisilvae]|uniref:NIPSNAP family protein n=1 Tax=Scleromatobacter humisilvae TaxID=2897159 RepID=A0A9X1YMA1_9BURK|nr:NIPSNAP family protein [Scleromatobacter humisilvae]MCK9686992.1 NIPSNAP family protein [Scleromatobacter humisilvae]